MENTLYLENLYASLTLYLTTILGNMAFPLASNFSMLARIGTNNQFISPMVSVNSGVFEKKLIQPTSRMVV